MARANLSSEDVIRGNLAPAIGRAEMALKAMQSDSPGDPSIAVALISTALLRRFIDKVADRAADQEAIARASVYLLVAEGAAAFLNRPADLVYPAVLALCGESDQSLIGALPRPDPEVLAAVESALLKVTATYDVAAPDSPGRRTVVAYLHAKTSGSVREQKSETKLPWEELPEDVREHILRTGARTVSFTLYPRAVAGGAP